MLKAMTGKAVRVAAGVVFGLSAGIACAQTYPAQPIEMTVGYPPGSSLDILARLLQPRMSQALGQQVVVQNRAGAGGNIGTAFVARAEPDGYRILLASNANLTINPHVYKDPGFDVFKDFTPVALLASGPVALVVRSDLGVDDLEALVKLARTRADRVTYGTPGAGSPMHLLGEMLSQEAGMELTHVPYRGSAPALNDLLGGSIDMVISSLATVTPFLPSDRIKVIALADDERYARMPDMPLVAETYPGVTAPAWFGLMAPAGTPPEVVARLTEAAQTALKDAPVQKGLETGALVAVGQGPAELDALIRHEYEVFGKVVKDRNIPAN